MKAVILAGGLGSRIGEETSTKPKPMIEIAGKPILWHILKSYSVHDINDFIICLGYRGYVIKEYFSNYFLHNSDVTLNLRENSMEVHQNSAEPWRITLVDTGLQTMTGGRVKRVMPYIGDEHFCLTYGDGLGDVNIRALIDFHISTGKLATVTAVQPAGRFGSLEISGERVERFVEKPAGDGGWINAGFFVLSPRVAEYIDGDDMAWEREPLQRLAKHGELAAFQHHGFWQPMDTLRDKEYLEELWMSGKPPWKIW